MSTPMSSVSHLPTRPPSSLQLTPVSPQDATPTNNSVHGKRSHKFFHMFDAAKTANFHVTVVIHELGNVPQLGGEFAVNWKFRGRRPKGKEALQSKPSLPNLKIGTEPSPSSSTLSIRSASTTSSPGTPTLPNTPSNIAHIKANSLPPPNALKITIPGSSPPKPKKKVSDPTPLKQSIIPQEDEATSSPVSIDRPLLDVPKGKLPVPPIGISQPSSATSSMSRLSVPLPEARSGNSSSPASILGSVGDNKDVPPPRQRTPSMRSVKSLSKPYSRKSEHRKGTTHSSPLRAHTCTWDYEIQHTIKVPLGKPIPISYDGAGTSTPRLRGTAPVVGGGPLSDSGLRLVIEQLPSASSVAAPVATSNKDSLSSALGNMSAHIDPRGPSDKAHTIPETQKTIFGSVNVDLAAFAGKGRMTRRFLLVGSRTNATIKLSVDMRWVGGEERWAAPPLQEGHHVTQLRDLLGEEVKDLNNMSRTPSNSSESSMPSNASQINLSASNLVAPPSQVAYKSYEHHLKLQPSPEPKEGETTESMFRRHTHRHRSHHSRHFRNPTALQQFSMHDLAPDVVVEAIFNPHPSKEEGPFTYVPKEENNRELKSSAAIVEGIWRDLQADVENVKSGKPVPPGRAKAHLERMKKRALSGRGKTDGDR